MKSEETVHGDQSVYVLLFGCISGQIGNQPQVVVSLAPGQQGGQVVYSTVAGQPVHQPVQQV